MDRKHDVLLNRFYPDIKNMDECKGFLSMSFYDSVRTLSKGAPSSALLAFFSFLCGYCTIYELKFMLGPYFQDFFSPIQYNVRTGCVEKFRLPVTDFGSYTAVHLTDEGFAAYLQGTGLVAEGGGVNQKKRTTARRSTSKNGKKGSQKSSVPIAPMHDYELGIAILSLISLRRGISISKEAVINSGKSADTSSTVRVDALVKVDSISSGYKKSNVYLEQDTGTETTRQLLTKLYSYGEARILDPDYNCIILSCHSPSGQPDDAFNVTAAAEFLEDAKKSGQESLYDYYAWKCRPLPVSERFSLESILFRLGVLDMGKRTGGDLFGRAFGDERTIEDLETYVRELKDGGSPYYERSVNARLTTISKIRLRGLGEALRNFVFNDVNEDKESFLRDYVLLGYGFFVLPSTLLANSSHLFLRADGGSRFDRYANSISGFYPDFSSRYAYCPCGSFDGAPNEMDAEDDKGRRNDAKKSGFVISLDFGRGEKKVRLCFANVFTSLAGDVVCFEHLGRDAGAFVRLTALAMAKNRDKLNVHVIAVCDSIEDADFFCRNVNPMPCVKGTGAGSGFRFTFLFEQTVREDGLSPLYEFKRPYSNVAPYLDPCTSLPSRPKRTNATLAEICSFLIKDQN